MTGWLLDTNVLSELRRPKLARLALDAPELFDRDDDDLLATTVRRAVSEVDLVHRTCFLRTTMAHIRFRFAPEKLVQALAFFADRGVRDLDKMKAAKLLFHADKYHLLTYGRPVIGDLYACMEYGPVPSASLNVMNDVIAHDSQYPPVGKELFSEYITVERFFRKHPVFRAKKKPDLDVFSDSDIEALEYAMKTSGGKSSWQLSQESHDEPAWKVANEQRAPGSSVIMDYRLFFEGHPEAADMLGFVEAQQEDRDAAEELATRRPVRDDHRLVDVSC